MGYRAWSALFFGFADLNLIEQPYFHRDMAWRALLGVPERTDQPQPDWDWRNYEKIHGCRYTWGDKSSEAGDCKCAYGFLLAEGDWEEVVEVGEVILPEDAETKLRRLAPFYKVVYQPPRLLLLSSYC